MLKHDKYWNWEVKKGSKIVYTEKEKKNGFNLGEIYEVVVPQATPSGIVVQDVNGNQLVGEHNWFSDYEDQKTGDEK